MPPLVNIRWGAASRRSEGWGGAPRAAGWGKLTGGRIWAAAAAAAGCGKPGGTPCDEVGVCPSGVFSTSFLSSSMSRLNLARLFWNQQIT